MASGGETGACEREWPGRNLKAVDRSGVLARASRSRQVAAVRKWSSEHRLPDRNGSGTPRGPVEVLSEAHRDTIRQAVAADRGPTRSANAVDLGPTARAAHLLRAALERGDAPAIRHPSDESRGRERPDPGLPQHRSDAPGTEQGATFARRGHGDVPAADVLSG